MKQNFRKINSPKDIRRVLSDTINKLLNDSMDTQTAQAIASVCSVLLRTIQATTFEERLKRLEEMLDSETGTDTKAKPVTPVTSDIRGMIHRVKDETSLRRG